MVSFVDKSNVNPMGMEPQMFLLYHLDDDEDDDDNNDSGGNSSANNDDMMMHVGGTQMERLMAPKIKSTMR
jgi:hypothetical protein